MLILTISSDASTHNHAPLHSHNLCQLDLLQPSPRLQRRPPQTIHGFWNDTSYHTVNHHIKQQDTKIRSTKLDYTDCIVWYELATKLHPQQGWWPSLEQFMATSQSLTHSHPLTHWESVGGISTIVSWESVGGISTIVSGVSWTINCVMSIFSTTNSITPCSSTKIT